VLLDSSGEPKFVGILYGAVAGIDYCNGHAALTTPNDPYTNLKECLHVDDVKAAIGPVKEPAKS
jgi:hypothetical protein